MSEYCSASVARKTAWMMAWPMVGESTASRSARTPRLRASCDECGTAKLKCDRGQPSCGRCRVLEVQCVYGVSRKAGKGARRPSSILTTNTAPAAATATAMRGGPFGAASSPAFNTTTCPVAAAAAAEADAPGAPPWSSFFSPGPTPDCSWAELADDFDPIDSLDLLASAHSPVPPPTPAVGDSDFSLFDAAPTQHDCLREAAAVLTLLSSSDPVSACSTPHPAHAPFDRVLSLSSDASKRIAPVLSRQCSRAPHLSLLHASVLARILVQLQRAAHSVQSFSNASPPLLSAAASRKTSVSAVSSAGTGPHSSSASMASDRAGDWPAAQAFQMNIGHFSVDDYRVGAAVQMQLLLGEIRRVGDLIEQFASRGRNDSDALNDLISTGLGNLNHSLASWLRGRHSALADGVKSKLRELDV